MDEEKSDDQREENYENGKRAVYLEVIRHCYREMMQGEEILPESYVIERTEAVQTLRHLCEEFGNNNWPDNLNLSDVIEKHLGRHLHQSSQRFDGREISKQ